MTRFLWTFRVLWSCVVVVVATVVVVSVSAGGPGNNHYYHPMATTTWGSSSLSNRPILLQYARSKVSKCQWQWRRRQQHGHKRRELILLASTSSSANDEFLRAREATATTTTTTGGTVDSACLEQQQQESRQEEEEQKTTTTSTTIAAMNDFRMPLIPWQRLFPTQQRRRRQETDANVHDKDEQAMTTMMEESSSSSRTSLLLSSDAATDSDASASVNDENKVANQSIEQNDDVGSDMNQQNQTLYYDPLEPFLTNNNNDREAHDSREQDAQQRAPSSRPRHRLDGIHDLMPALAQLRPSSSSSSIATSLGSKIVSVLRHPQTAKWTMYGLQVTLIMSLLSAIVKTATQVLMDEVGSDASLSHLLKVGQVEEILASLEVAAATSSTKNKNDTLTTAAAASSSSSILEQQPLLQHLTDTLLASGMPLRASQEHDNSVEQVLLSLTRLEASLLQQCLWTPFSETKATTFADITGLHSIKQSLLDLVWTIKSNASRKHKRLNPFAHLIEHPPGILLYGPPGCGKTLLVKALAGAANVPCLVVTPSVLLRKYVGDTNLHVRALFSLAQKLSPCIMCVDELDGLFRERSSNEHDVSRDLKTEFLQHWDGITTRESQILIVGASNRPFEVDSAVLRRMPQSYFVGLPNYEARKSLLSSLLSSVPTSSDLSLHPLAAETEGYTPSDLKQVVRMAITMGPIREARFSLRYRPLTMKDVAQARAMVSPTPLTPGYRSALMDYAQRSNTGGHVATQGNQNPWDSFYNAGTIHASPGIDMQAWSENDEVESDLDEDEDYSYDQDPDTDESDD